MSINEAATAVADGKSWSFADTRVRQLITLFCIFALSWDRKWRGLMSWVVDWCSIWIERVSRPGRPSSCFKCVRSDETSWESTEISKRKLFKNVLIRHCYVNQLAPKCKRCNQVIVENFIAALDGCWHPTCFVCAVSQEYQYVFPLSYYNNSIQNFWILNRFEFWMKSIDKNELIWGDLVEWIFF